MISPKLYLIMGSMTLFYVNTTQKIHLLITKANWKCLGLCNYQNPTSPAYHILQKKPHDLMFHEILIGRTNSQGETIGPMAISTLKLDKATINSFSNKGTPKLLNQQIGRNKRTTHLYSATPHPQPKNKKKNTPFPEPFKMFVTPSLILSTFTTNLQFILSLAIKFLIMKNKKKSP